MTELLYCPFMSVFVFLFMFLLILSGREERAAVVGIENPAFDGGGSTELSVPPVWLGREIRGDRPDSTLAAHQKKMELQAPAKERGEASFFISLKFVDSRCVPDLTFLSLPLSFSLYIRGALGPCIPKRACPNKQPSYNFFLRWRTLQWWVFYLYLEVPSTQSALTPTLGYMPCGGLES